MNNGGRRPPHVTNYRDKGLQNILSRALIVGKLKASPDLKVSLVGKILKGGGLQWLTKLTMSSW